ncbi:MAG: winged helix DNA-binding protein [Sphingomonadaceae bacterium]|nr:winged helix DNA-binding protein [Sphingomonadaceae bacterium]
MTVHAPIQADFTYGEPACDPAGLPLSVSIYADRGHLRDTMRDDARAAGISIRETATLAGLLEGAARPLGEVVILDCPQADGAMLAALARLDMRAARSGARLIVSTTVDGLDDIFGCMDQSNPQLLVDPSRADRVIALGQLLGGSGGLRLRELSEEDRLVLLRLTEQVGQIAQRLDRLDGGSSPAHEADDRDSAFRFEAPGKSFSGKGDDSERLVRAARPALPDPRMVRRIIRQRQLRARFFDGELFADPAWDMLLDLTSARAEHSRVSVTSLCIASGVPPTTALRWIGQMTEAGLFERVEDDTDRRRAFIALTDKAADGMARYFAELGRSASQLV